MICNTRDLHHVRWVSYYETDDFFCCRVLARGTLCEVVAFHNTEPMIVQSRLYVTCNHSKNIVRGHVFEEMP